MNALAACAFLGFQMTGRACRFCRISRKSFGTRSDGILEPRAAKSAFSNNGSSVKLSRNAHSVYATLAPGLMQRSSGICYTLVEVLRTAEKLPPIETPKSHYNTCMLRPVKRHS
jgi:hypothetical protein